MTCIVIIMAIAKSDEKWLHDEGKLERELRKANNKSEKFENKNKCSKSWGQEIRLMVTDTVWSMDIYLISKSLFSWFIIWINMKYCSRRYVKYLSLDFSWKTLYETYKKCKGGTPLGCHSRSPYGWPVDSVILPVFYFDFHYKDCEVLTRN